MKKFMKYKKSLKNINNYIYALCEIAGEKRIPFYIGRGKDDRCLHHLSEEGDSIKVEKIQELLKSNLLGIDILRHGIKNEETAKLIEATCIDLLGVGELSNKVRGSSSAMGRMTLEEIHLLQINEETAIEPKHSGLAFLLNSTYTSGMSDLELYEATRGVWHNVPRDESIKYAYATYGGIIKEIYEIHGWFKAGTQEYFSRIHSAIKTEGRWEFIGRKATQDVRIKYLGKLIAKGRSFGSPFMKVGI